MPDASGHAHMRPGVVLTRPAGQSAALIAPLREAGFDIVEFPLIAISPAADSKPLDDALARLDDYALVVLVSPNAIDHAFARFTGVWPERLPFAVVGPGSVAALNRHGIEAPRYRIIAPDGAHDQARAAAAARVVSSDSFFPPPEPAADKPVDPDSVRFDSETLLAALERELGLDSFAGRRVLLLRGDGGRELVADTLRARGAQVDAVAAYQRSVPIPDPAALTQIRRWLAGHAHLWVITSSEGVRNLDTLAAVHLDDHERAVLHATPVIVPHPRIAESARASGFDKVTVSGAGDAALLRAIASNRPEPPGATYSEPRVSTASLNEPVTPDAVERAGPSVNSATGDPAHAGPSPRIRDMPAASSTPRGASSSMTDSKDTSPNATIQPTRFSASGAEQPAPVVRQRGRLVLIWIALVIAVGAVAGGLALNRKLDRVEHALADREQTNARTAATSQQDSARALDAAQQTDRRLSQIEGKLADAQGQEQALQNMYQDLARDRTQWTLSEIGQVISNASQQLQLTGNVQLALYALQSADARLAATEGAQIITIRKAIATDIDKLKAAPTVDIAGLAIKLDDAIARIDSLPLAGEVPASHPTDGAASDASWSGAASGAGSSAGSAPASAADTSLASGASGSASTGNALSNAVRRFDAWWSEFGTRLVHQLAGVVQVRRIDNADAMLVAPDQGQYLRANLKLRLLSARLSLLSRDEKTMQSDLDAADAALARYFDPASPATRTVRDLVSQVRHTSTSVELPNLNASLDAIHQYKSGE